MGSPGKVHRPLPRTPDRETPAQGAAIAPINRRQLLALGGLALLAGRVHHPPAAGPEGQRPWGVHISLPPPWFDPAETPGMITPFMLLYALHDAMVKPMPGQAAE